jgi:hypothetical protein
VGRVHRRLCFLRTEGRDAEAREVADHEMAAAVADARRDSGSESEADALLTALIAEGEERVADAVAFAEVLLPMLRRELGSPSAESVRAAESPRQRRARPERHGEAPGIADFIDEMLAQDRAGTR